MALTPMIRMRFVPFCGVSTYLVLHLVRLCAPVFSGLDYRGSTSEMTDINPEETPVNGCRSC